MSKIQDMIDDLETIVSKDELFTLCAKSVRKSVDALLAEGFSRKEAIDFVTRQGGFVKGS